jgi:hypothetical protein
MGRRPGRYGKYKMPRHPAHGAGGFKIDGVPCRLVSLTKGQFAIVEETRFEEINQSNWVAAKGSRNHGHYAVRKIAARDGEAAVMVFMHRQLLGLSKGDPRTGDHKDPLKTLLNISSNLRVATEEDQQHNRGMNRNNTSGVKGVRQRSDRDHFLVRITVNGKSKYVGSAKTLADAAALRIAAANKLHGEFARHK